MPANFPNGIDLNLTSLLNAILHPLATRPAAPRDGQVWTLTSGVLEIRLAGATISLGRLDQTSPPTSTLNLNNQKIGSLADGTAGTDATTLQQVQNMVAAITSGLAPKDSVRIAVSSNVNIASPGATLDGVTFAAGDQNRRVALLGQTDATQNGIWDWNGGASPMTRSADAATGAALSGAFAPVEQGSQADTVWMITTDGITLGTTAISWTRIFGGNAVQLRKFTLTYGGSATQTIAHNLGTTEFVWSCRDATTNNPVFPDVVPIDANTAEAREAVAPGANSRKIVIEG